MEIKKEPIAIICLSPYGGGMEIDAIKLSKKLSLYADVVLIAKKGFFIDDKKDDYLNTKNIQLETINFRSSFSFNIIFSVREIIKKYNIKNVVFFGASELKSLYFSFLGFDINLIIRHGTTKSTPKKDWFHKLIYSNVNYHVSICKHLEENVKYIIPFCNNTKSKLIYSSFESDDVKNNKNTKLTLLHIGRIANAKGQVDAILACEVLFKDNMDFEFNIVGGFDESYKNEFMDFYEKCEYKDKIKLIGFTNDIKSYLYKSDVFIFPSHGEGLSNAFIEALSNNLVCISYDNTSFPELKELGLYFKTVQNKNIDQLKKILLSTSENLLEEKHKSFANNDKVKELFSLDKEMNSYLDILK